MKATAFDLQRTYRDEWQLIATLTTDSVQEAMRLVDNYMRLVSSNNSKLKLSKPFVKRLIYIPCRSGSNGPVLPEMFGKLVPAVMQDPCMANTIVIE